MKNKGFTLIELLAVIVVLGVIMTIAGVSVMKIRNDAALQEAKKLEDTIKSLGADVYLDKKESGKYDLSDLTMYGLKSDTIKNPNGNGNCSGYLEISDKLEFSGHICCPGLYMTGSNDKPTEDDCSNKGSY